MQKHIVIIEDDADISLVMATVLEDGGYMVTCFSEVQSIETLIELRPDCFILDEQLPHVSGHILCMVLKSKPATKNIPVILTSASNQLDGFADLSEADASLKKPFDIYELLKLVASVIEKAAGHNQ